MEYENPNRLLVVEDNAEVRALAIRIGTLSGDQCAGCASLSEFHREFSSLSPTVILLDLVLGDEDALPVIDFLASVQYRNPVLLMSAHDHRLLQSVQLSGRDRGLHIAGIIEKRMGMERLEHALNSYMIGTRGAVAKEKKN